MKVLLSSFHLNGHTGFHPHTQKLQPLLLTQGDSVGVKGLIKYQIMKYSTSKDHDSCYRPRIDMISKIITAKFQHQFVVILISKNSMYLLYNTHP